MTLHPLLAMPIPLPSRLLRSIARYRNPDLPRQTKHSLTYDVAAYFGGSATDCSCEMHEVRAGPLIPPRVSLQCPWSKQIHRGSRNSLDTLRVIQLEKG